MDDRRLAPRRADVAVVVHQCILTQLGKEIWLAAEAVDLSPQGVCLLLSESLNSGESIYLLTTVKVGDKTPRDLEVNGVTTYCKAHDDGRRRVGLKFIDLAPWEKDDWGEFLKG